jgi:hypothetical protein
MALFVLEMFLGFDLSKDLENITSADVRKGA